MYLFWVLSAKEATPIIYDTFNLQKILMFICRETQPHPIFFFLKTLQRFCKIIILGKFWYGNPCPQKLLYQPEGNVNVYPYWKLNFILPFFLEILQRYCNLVTFSTLDMPVHNHQKTLVSVWEKLWCLFSRKDDGIRLIKTLMFIFKQRWWLCQITVCGKNTNSNIFLNSLF